jgi:hypothetical protein
VPHDPGLALAVAASVGDGDGEVAAAAGALAAALLPPPPHHPEGHGHHGQHHHHVHPGNCAPHESPPDAGEDGAVGECVWVVKGAGMPALDGEYVLDARAAPRLPVGAGARVGGALFRPVALRSRGASLLDAAPSPLPDAPLGALGAERPLAVACLTLPPAPAARGQRRRAEDDADWGSVCYWAAPGGGEGEVTWHVGPGGVFPPPRVRQEWRAAGPGRKVTWRWGDAGSGSEAASSLPGSAAASPAPSSRSGRGGRGLGVLESAGALSGLASGEALVRVLPGGAARGPAAGLPPLGQNLFGDEELVALPARALRPAPPKFAGDAATLRRDVLAVTPPPPPLPRPALAPSAQPPCRRASLTPPLVSVNTPSLFGRRFWSRTRSPAHRLSRVPPRCARSRAPHAPLTPPSARRCCAPRAATRTRHCDSRPWRPTPTPLPPPPVSRVSSVRTNQRRRAPRPVARSAATPGRR